MFNKEDIVWKIENKLIFYYDLIKIGFKFQPKRIVEQHQSLALESPSIEAALLITLPARKHILTGLWAEQTVSPQKLTWGPFPCSFHLSKEGVSNHIILNQSALDSDTIVHIDGQMGIWSQPKETKEWKGQCLSYLQWMNKISHNLFSSHHTTNPVCALSTAIDSHLVIFRARHIQPEGTNYSSVFSMLQCLQRAVLEKYTYLLSRKSLRKQRRGLSVMKVKFIPKSTKGSSLGSWTCSGGKLSGLKLIFKVALWIELFLCTISKYCCLKGVEISRTRHHAREFYHWEPEQRTEKLFSSHFGLLKSQLFGKALFSHVSVQENEISNATETETPTIDVGLYEWDREAYCLIPSCSCVNCLCNKSQECRPPLHRKTVTLV